MKAFSGRPASLQMNQRKLSCCRKTFPNSLLIVSGLERVFFFFFLKQMTRELRREIKIGFPLEHNFIHTGSLKWWRRSWWCSRPWGLSWSELPCPSVSGSVCGQTGSSVGAVYHVVFHVNIWKKVICHSYLMTGKHQILWTCVPNGNIDAVCILQSWIYVYWLYIHLFRSFGTHHLISQHFDNPKLTLKCSE